MIEQVVTEVGKGLFRGVGYLVAELVFWRICYGIGWPICKVLSFGYYPKRKHQERALFRDEHTNKGFTCSVVGMLTLVIIGLFLTGHLPGDIPAMMKHGRD